MRCSRSGLLIAFWKNDQAGQRDICTIAASGAKDSVVPVTSDAPLDWSPAWGADGQGLFFISDRDGTMNLWRVAIDEKSGRTRSDPEPVRAPAERIEWLSSSRADPAGRPKSVVGR